MDEQTANDFDTEHRDEAAVGAGQLYLSDQRVELGLHGVVTDFPYPRFDRVQPVERDTEDFTTPVFDTQHDRSTPTVGHAGQLIGKFVAIGCRDTRTPPAILA